MTYTHSINLDNSINDTLVACVIPIMISIAGVSISLILKTFRYKSAQVYESPISGITKCFASLIFHYSLRIFLTFLLWDSRQNVVNSDNHCRLSGNRDYRNKTERELQHCNVECTSVVYTDGYSRQIPFHKCRTRTIKCQHTSCAWEIEHHFVYEICIALHSTIVTPSSRLTLKGHCSEWTMT